MTERSSKKSSKRVMISSVSQENLAPEREIRLNKGLYSEKLWKSTNSLDLPSLYGFQPPTAAKYFSFTTDDIREGSNYLDSRASMSKSVLLAQKYVTFFAVSFQSLDLFSIRVITNANK